MARERRAGLEIDEDLRFQRRFLTVQRAGLLLMTLAVLAALAGLLGASGPLSHGQAQAGELGVRYARFARGSSATTLELRIAPSAVRDGVVRIWISSAYLERLPLERASPPPRSVVLGAERTTFVFDASADGAGPVSALLELRPRALLSAPGTAGLDGGAQVAFHTLVYP